ncbi:MAG: beta-L-arabinofuranosidase domain-containing protein [Armatimonadota bacterium]
MRTILMALLLSGFLPVSAALSADAAPPDKTAAVPRLALEPDPHARFEFSDLLGSRVARNTREWLIPAPEANPGMLEMFRVRDRLPKPQLVPWAGEFAGKHLISGVQALRQHENPALRESVASLVKGLLSTQAEDGYLGPFTRAERLRGHWDLWGHYHCMLGLLTWHEQTGDAAALRGTMRAADLICATYLDTGRRVHDAGSPEMNMAVIHVLGRLYRLVGEPRYLRMAREIEKDWERAGDYFRTGLAGVEFFQTPTPRWESLHDLQGLVELYQITGDDRYRTAFEHHWRSILRWDRRNTGGFSSGEQATGDPYAATAIETCCTVAWMALTLDMLRLTGDPLAADELELSTYNAGVGAQHPSGRWWTYDTPMDGAREASAHTIVFQARAGTPELNCCSVNGPRALGMLSEWAVMRDGAGLTVNAYAPGRFDGKLESGLKVRLDWETDYPRSGRVTLAVRPEKATRFPLRLRIPRWSERTVVRVNGKAVEQVQPGRYLALDRRWAKGDRVELELDMALRAVAGDRDALGKVSLYRGPLLLAFDPRDNDFDEERLPPLDLARLAQASLSAPKDGWVLLQAAGSDGTVVRLRDFASAGATGRRYRSWLPAASPLPPPPVTRLPRDGAAVPKGRVLFRWTGPSSPNDSVNEYRLIVADDPELKRPVVRIPAVKTNWVVAGEQLEALKPGTSYWWGVEAVNAHGTSRSTGPAARLTLDPTLPPLTEAQLRPPAAVGVLLRAALSGAPDPGQGTLTEAEGASASTGPGGEANGAVRLDGARGRLKYAVDQFPEEEYTVAVRVRIDALPSGRIAQVFSAWTAPADDPLRITVDSGKLFARIEAGGSFSTPGFPVTPGRWYDVVAVKQGPRLLLYVDGQVVGQSAAPLSVRSRSREVALGGNPRYAGNEFLAATFADFSLHGRAFTAEEVRERPRP